MPGADTISLRIADKAQDYATSLIDTDGSVKMNIKTKKSFIAGCFVAPLLWGLDKNNTKLFKIGDYIKQQQRNDGFFWDFDFFTNSTATHNQTYLLWQFTTHALTALSCCGYSNNLIIAFEPKYCDSFFIRRWLDKLDWRNAWFQGNLVMFFAISLHHNYVITSDLKYLKALDTLIDWLDEFQDPTTGFWGTEYGSSLRNAMAGAFHEFLIYRFVNRKVNYIEKIIDSTISLVNKKDNLFSPYVGGGACEDLDAIDILVSFSKNTTYRMKEIDKILLDAKNKITIIQNLDGGFPYSTRKSFHFDLVRFAASIWLKKMSREERRARMKQLPLIIKKKCLPFSFSGNPSVYVDPHDSDIFSTWFRILSIALVDSYFSRKSPNQNLQWYNFSPHIGIGWH